MSKRKDRERAESGTIFRDGKLVNKEEWYAVRPTKGMKAERQVGVDDAVAELVEAKQLAEEASNRSIIITNEREAAGAPPFDYFCTKCERTHKHGSKVHEEHSKYAREA